MRSLLIHCLLALGLLAGCGQTGPLYLPEQAEAPAEDTATESAGD